MVMAYESVEFFVPTKDDSLVTGSANSTIASSTDSESSFLLHTTSRQYSSDSSQKKKDAVNIKTRNSAAADLRLSMLSNFSTAYNVLSISLVLDILGKQQQPSILTVADKSLCSSALFAGMIVGQLAGGMIGDILGRHMAMALVMLLQVGAAIGSSLSVSLLGVSVFQVLSFWRFVLGVGCGGVYPLAATLTAESSDENEGSSKPKKEENQKARRVALAFSFQGVGYLTVPVTAWIVLWLFDEETSDLAWRLLLGLGALPGLVLTVSRVRHNVQHKLNNNNSTDNNSVPVQERPLTEDTKHGSRRRQPTSVLDAIRDEPQLLRKLLGTAGCWLLFDVLFYGNNLFQPIVLGCAFGTEEESVHKAARDSALIAALALPGYWMSVWMVGRQTPRFIQLQGFLIMAILYAGIALWFDSMSGNRFLLLGVYGSTYFFSNYGPNCTTFMLPAMTFSKKCRSTLNGICAASGKVGALIGSIVFASAAERFGLPTVFWACSTLSVVGFAVTKLTVARPDAVADGAVEPEQKLAQVLAEQGTFNDTTKRIASVYSMPSLFDFHESG